MQAQAAAFEAGRWASVEAIGPQGGGSEGSPEDGSKG
jgi:hypothetical protein